MHCGMQRIDPFFLFGNCKILCIFNIGYTLARFHNILICRRCFVPFSRVRPIVIYCFVSRYRDQHTRGFTIHFSRVCRSQGVDEDARSVSDGNHRAMRLPRSHLAGLTSHIARSILKGEETDMAPCPLEYSQNMSRVITGLLLSLMCIVG